MQSYGVVSCLAIPLLVTPAGARDDTSSEEPVTSAGPGRIICNGAFCELAMAERTRPRIRVIVSGLPAEQIRRLRKCTGVAKPCVVSVSGVAREHPFHILATEILWQD